MAVILKFRDVAIGSLVSPTHHTSGGHRFTAGHSEYLYVKNSERTGKTHSRIGGVAEWLGEDVAINPDEDVVLFNPN
jgi:hypothetical protein